MDYPLVSAILPTRGRSALAQRALDCWYAQSWPNKELIVADDKEEKSFGSRLFDTGIHYYGVPGRLTIGEKRNLCVERSHGEYIVHFDSDDWSAPDHISDQMARILASRKAVTGYHHLLFTDGPLWWRYGGQVFSGLPKGSLGVFGTSLLYQKDWWRRHRFIAGPKNFNNYEDQAFVLAAVRAGQLIGAPAGEHMYARIHADNSSPKRTSDPSSWKRVADPDILGPLLLARV